MHFTYKKHTDEFVIKMEHPIYPDDGIVVGTISSNNVRFNENVLLPNLSFKRDEIEQMFDFMTKYDSIKLCEACGRKFVPNKSHQRFCSGNCRARKHAQNKRHIS